MENWKTAKNLLKKMTKSNANKNFEQILLEAVDEVWSTIGEGIQTSIYVSLESKFKIKKHEIPQRVNEFLDALNRIFGKGSRYLEILLMKSLQSKMKLVSNCPVWCRWVTPEVTCQEYIRLMKQKFEETITNEKEVKLFFDAGEKQEQYH